MFGAGLEGDFSPCPHPATRDVPESHPGLGACRAGASLVPHWAPPRGEKKYVESCRICNSTWQPQLTWWELLLPSRPAGTRAPGRPCQRRVGAREGWKEGEGGRERGRTPRRGQRRRIILFHFGGVNYTRSDSGRRELKRSGFVSVNCLEAGLFFTLARHARAGSRAGEMPGSGAEGSAGPGGRSWLRERSSSGWRLLFPERWRPLGFGEGLSWVLLGGSCFAKASGRLMGPLTGTQCLLPRGGSRLSPRTQAKFGTAVPKLSKSAWP